MNLPYAISLHAPWAWAIFHAGKDVENRSRNFPKRHGGLDMVGRVWIHASLWPGRGELWPSQERATRKWETFFAEFQRMIRLAQLRGSVHTEHGWQRADAMRGHIVGSVEVTGYRTPDDPPESPWYFPGSLGLILRNPTLLETPIPAKGALQWWLPSESVRAQLEAA